MTSALLLILHTVLLQAPAKGLKPYTLSPGFSVSLPSAPEVLKIPAAKGDPKLQTWLVKVEGGGFLISVVDTASEEERTWTPKKILVNFMAGYMHSTKGEELSRKDIQQDSWQGIESTFTSSGNITSRQRCYSVNGVIYQVVALAGPPKTSLPMGQAVLDSMKLPKSK